MAARRAPTQKPGVPDTLVRTRRVDRPRTKCLLMPMLLVLAVLCMLLMSAARRVPMLVYSGLVPLWW